MGCGDILRGWWELIKAWFAMLWALVKPVLLNITVEPCYFLFCVGTGLYMIVSAQLYIEKVCLVNLDYGHEVCDNLTADENEDAQNEVQRYVSKLKIYSRVLEAVPSVLFTLFAGPWSDKHGRKFLLMSSVFGTLISTAVYIVNVKWYYELKAEYLLFEALKDCFGGFACFFMAAHAYIADVTDHATRTKRMAFLTGLWPIGSNIGKALSGVIKTNLGFMYNFGFGFLTSAITLLYVFFFMKESTVLRDERLKRERDERNKDLAESEKPEEEEEAPPKATLKTKFIQFFDLRNLKEGFLALVKPRKHHIRLYLLLLIICFEMEQFINVGDWDYAYLYLRKQLDFTITDFTTYTTVMGVVGITCQYITIPVMSEKLGVRDSVITIIDISGCFVQTLLLAFVKHTWMIYLGMVIAFLDMSSYAMIRCMISKLVDHDELGKILSLVGAVQAFVPLISSSVFGLIYRATVEDAPNTHYFVIAALFFIDWSILMVIDHGFRRMARSKKKEEQDQEEEEAKEEMLEKKSKPIMLNFD